MFEPNEQLIVRAVTLYKKKEGQLIVTPRRIVWRQNGVSEFNPVISYNDIDRMEQTPQTSEKVILQIRCHSAQGKPYKFTFITPRALQDRENVISNISEILERVRRTTGAPANVRPRITSDASPGTDASPSTTRAPTPSPSPSIPKTPSGAISSRNNSPPTNRAMLRHEELKAREELLKGSQELLTLHMELVLKGKTVKEEEFWASPHVKRIRRKLKKDTVAKEGQRKGQSSKMLDLRPNQQEGSDFKFTLTGSIIHDIFTEYPSVKRAYDANVPDKLTEGQFWKRFLSSEYFHRSKKTSSPDDIFSQSMQEENGEISMGPEPASMEKLRRIIDLAASAEDHEETGNAPDFTMTPGQDKKALPLIRRFNRRAMRILEGTPSSIPSRKSLDQKEPADEIESAIIFEDLQDVPPPEHIKLDIQDTGYFFESQVGSVHTRKRTREESDRELDEYKTKILAWQPNLTKLAIKPGATDHVCRLLTQTIRRQVRHGDKNTAKDKLPPHLQRPVLNYHSTTNELLRHFWSSFEPYREEKNARMIEGLRKQQERYKDMLAKIQNQGEATRFQEMLHPQMEAVERALESTKKRERKKR